MSRVMIQSRGSFREKSEFVRNQELLQKGRGKTNAQCVMRGRFCSLLSLCVISSGAGNE
jgi:hypothetical protein